MELNTLFRYASALAQPSAPAGGRCAAAQATSATAPLYAHGEALVAAKQLWHDRQAEQSTNDARRAAADAPPGAHVDIDTDANALDMNILSSALVASMFFIPDSPDAQIFAPPTQSRPALAAVTAAQLLSFASLDELRLGTYAQQAAAQPLRILSGAYWQSLAPGLTAAGVEPCGASLAGDAPLSARHAEVDIIETGYTRIDNPVSAVGASMLTRLVAGVKALRAAGYPPVFIFMFDEMWHYVDRMFDGMQQVLGKDVQLEPSIFAWALTTPDASSAAPTIGGSFTLPHRDYSYSECWQPDGRPSLLNLWMPLTEATLENGCMYVLPREFDAYFDDSQHAHHLKCALPGAALDGATAHATAAAPTYSDTAFAAAASLPAEAAGVKQAPHVGRELRLKFDVGGARPLPCPAGTLLTWTGNTIHWGSTCSRRAPEPRMSVALAFRRESARRSHLEFDMPCMARTDMRAACTSLATRLRLIVKGLLLFKWWFGDAVPESALPPALWQDLRAAYGAMLESEEARGGVAAAGAPPAPPALSV